MSFCEKLKCLSKIFITINYYIEYILDLVEQSLEIYIDQTYLLNLHKELNLEYNSTEDSITQK